jgi:hypothetical protein
MANSEYNSRTPEWSSPHIPVCFSYPEGHVWNPSHYIPTSNSDFSMDGYNSNVNFTDLFRELLEGVYHRCGRIYSSTEYHPL